MSLVGKQLTLTEYKTYAEMFHLATELLQMEAAHTIQHHSDYRPCFDPLFAIRTT